MRVTHPPLNTRAGDHLAMRVEKQRPLTRCPRQVGSPGPAAPQGSGRAFSLSEAQPTGHFHPGPAQCQGAGSSLLQFYVHLGRTGLQRRAEPAVTMPLHQGMATTSTDSPGQGCSPEHLGILTGRAGGDPPKDRSSTRGHREATCSSPGPLPVHTQREMPHTHTRTHREHCSATGSDQSLGSELGKWATETGKKH